MPPFLRAMTPYLAGPRLKLNRAKEHLNSLNDLLQPFAQSERERVTQEFNQETSCQEFWLDPTPSPPEWGPLIGDVLYNSRSALDHLANQLAGGDINDRETFWPIFCDPGQFSRKGEPFIQGMPDDAQTFVKESQPYARGHKLPRNDVLAVLNRLSNADKHRHLHVGVVSIRSAGWAGEWDIQDFFGGVVEGRTKLASVPVSGPDVHVLLQFILQVAFAHCRRWQMPIAVIRFFEEAIREIEALFGGCIGRRLLSE